MSVDNSLVWLEVSVDNAVAVEVLQRQHRLGKIHPASKTNTSLHLLTFHATDGCLM